MLWLACYALTKCSDSVANGINHSFDPAADCTTEGLDSALCVRGNSLGLVLRNFACNGSPATL